MGIFEDLTKPISQQSDTSGFDFDAYLQEKIKPYKKKTVAPDSTSEFTPEKVTSNIDKITNFFSDAGDALTGFGSEAMAAVPAITEYGMKQAQRLAENPIGAIINNPTNQAITKLTDLALGSDTSKTLQSVSDKTKGISTFSAIDKVTGNSLTDATNEMTTKLSDFKTEVRKKIPDSFWGRLGASGADMALVGGASVGTGLLTGNPAAASSVAYGLSTALEGGALYDTLKEKGLSEDESLKVSGQIGAIIGLLDSIVPGKLGSKAAGEIGKKLSGNLLKRMVKSNVITEIGTENLQELISTATEYNYSTKEERDELIKRLPQQALETTAMSALMGGAMQVVGKGLDIKNEKSRTKLEEEFGTGEEITTETVIEPEQIAKPEVEEVKLTPEQQLKKIRNDAISTEYKATIKNIDDSKAEIRREVNRLNGELKIAKNDNEIIDEKRISGELTKLKEQLKSLDSQRKTAKEDAIKKIDEVENLKENEPTEGLTQEKSPVDLFNERMKPKEVKLLNARKTSPELPSNASKPNYRTQPLTVEERYDATNEMKLADKIKNLRVKINEPKVKNKKELKAELKRAILQLNEISRAKANKQLNETNFEQQTADLQKLTPTEATEPQTPVKGMEVKQEVKEPVKEEAKIKGAIKGNLTTEQPKQKSMVDVHNEALKLHKSSYGLKDKNKLQRLLSAKAIMDEAGYDRKSELYTENDRLINNIKQTLGIKTNETSLPVKEAVRNIEETKYEMRKSKGGWSVDKKENNNWGFVQQFRTKKEAQNYIDSKQKPEVSNVKEEGKTLLKVSEAEPVKQPSLDQQKPLDKETVGEKDLRYSDVANFELDKISQLLSKYNIKITSPVQTSETDYGISHYFEVINPRTGEELKVRVSDHPATNKVRQSTERMITLSDKDFEQLEKVTNPERFDITDDKPIKNNRGEVVSYSKKYTRKEGTKSQQTPSKDRIVEPTGAKTEPISGEGEKAPVSKRVFSEDKYKQDRKDANDILNRPNLIGAQLEAVPQMLRIAGYHLENVVRAGIEKGRQFTEWTKSMIKDLGGKIRPYLKKIWEETQRQFGKKLLQYAEKNPFIRGMNVVEGSLFTNDNLPPVRKYTDKDLEVLFEKNPVVRKKVSEFTKKTKETADDILRPMSAEIEQIDKDTYAAIKENDFETLAETNRRIKQITPFLEKFVRFRKYQPKEFAKLSYYLTANNMVEAEKIMSKWKMSEAFKPVRDALNELYVEGVKVKYDLGYLKDYFPRDMVDYEGYLKEIRGKKAFDVFQELIDKKNAERKKKGEAVLTTDEENKLITNAIRGYNPGISLSGIANYKERVIKAFPPSYAKYYDTAENALINYIVKATDAIQQRKLFGYGVDAEASIASYIKGKGLDAEKSAKLKRILKARYNFMSNKWASQVRGIMYLTTLNNPTSSIKNLADVPMALYNSGSLTKTFVALGRALVDKSVIKMEDAGLHNMGGEYMNLSSRNKATNAMMKWMLAFPYFDKVGKETYINATMSKYHKLANSNPDKLKTKLGKWFNEERASQVVSDLRQKKSYKDIGKTNLLNLVAYLEISDVQPTTMTEMPLKYAESPNGRVLYTMKSFQLKRLDFFRKETLHKIRTKGQRLEGFRNLAMLTTMIGLGEAGTEQIISWLLGRDESFTEQIADSMLSIIGFNRYDVEKAKRTNPIDVIFNKALPIATPLKDLWDDYETAADNYELTRYLTTHKTDRPFKAKSLNALPWVRTIRKNIENR